MWVWVWVWLLSIVVLRTPSPSDAAVGNDTSPVKNNDTVELVHVASNKLLNRSVTLDDIIHHADDA